MSGITVDTRIALKVIEITDPERVQSRIKQLYGRRGGETDGAITVDGSGSLFKSRYGYGDLLHIMDRLTGEGGCPWDISQTHESIRINAVEEAYELVAAINMSDVDNMEEETGDLLLQSVFHAYIAEKNGEFTLEDVIDRLCRKLVSRHTHIFGGGKADNAAEALKSWDAAKAKEKNGKTLPKQLDDLSKDFPALLYAQKAIKKMVKAGLVNDAAEVTTRELFSAVAGAVKAGLDAETDIRGETDKLARDFFAGETKTIK